MSRFRLQRCKDFFVQKYESGLLSSADSWDVFTRLKKRWVFESFNCRCLFHSQYKYQTSIWEYVNWWNSIQAIKWNVMLPLPIVIKSSTNKLSATMQFSLRLKLCLSFCSDWLSILFRFDNTRWKIVLSTSYNQTSYGEPKAYVDKNKTNQKAITTNKRQNP